MWLGWPVGFPEVVAAALTAVLAAALAATVRRAGPGRPGRRPPGPKRDVAGAHRRKETVR
jgi:hypothetical protein